MPRGYTCKISHSLQSRVREEEERVTAHPGCGPGESTCPGKSISLCLKIQTTLLTARGVKRVRKLNPWATIVSSSYTLFLLILIRSLAPIHYVTPREQPDVTYRI